MIIAETKPIKELLEMTAPYSRLLVAGCGTCVTVCYAGGEKEVAILASLLRLAGRVKGKGPEVAEVTVKRQCEQEFLEEMHDRVAAADAVVSLACAAGIQLLADRYPGKVILPGVNTLCIGAVREQAAWDEECRGCGDCQLDLTAGVCLVTRCLKGQMNAPCGFSKDGRCEADEKVECAWVTMARRWQESGRKGVSPGVHPPRDWYRSASGPQRRLDNERMKVKHGEQPGK